MSIIDEIVDYKENEENIKHWTALKGEFRYGRIIDFMKKNNVPRAWKNVTNYVKYDKRILINTFKYIVFLEEYYKSMIYKYKRVNADKLIEMQFRPTVNMYLSIGKKANFDKMNLSLLKNNKETVIQLRNSVVHNKILLDGTFDKNDLKTGLNFLEKILPESYREGFKKDINSCTKGLVEEYWHIEL